MRQLSSFSWLLLFATLANGCDSAVASRARTRAAGEFRVLMPAEPATLNPDLDLDEPAMVVGRNIFNQLISLNETGRVLPELALSWDVSPDGLTYTFHLAQEVRWHDGVPFTSEDVRWTLETIRKDGFAGREVLEPVADIATPDPATVVITLKHPWAPFTTDLATPGLSILPRHVYQGQDWRNHPANHKPIGTGPFKFSSWTDDTIMLVANPDYFRAGPYVERIVFHTVTPDKVTPMLLNGEADYSMGRPADLDLSAPAPDPLAVHTLPTSSRVYLAMNLRRAPLGDRRVRLALASAIDRGAIVRSALRGFGAPAVGWYTPDVEWAYNSNARVPDLDLTRARQLLDEAGWRVKNGERFSIGLVVLNLPGFRDIASMLASQLGAIEVRTAIELVSPEEWPKRTLVNHDFDLTLVAGMQGPDPDQLRRRFLATSDTGAYIGYDAADFREAVERGARVVDLAERAAAYHRAQEILARDVPIVPIAENVKIVVHNRRVSGLPQLEARGLVGAFDFSLIKLGGPHQAATR